MTPDFHRTSAKPSTTPVEAQKTKKKGKASTLPRKTKTSLN